jgi:hypothetical protein
MNNNLQRKMMKKSLTVLGVSLTLVSGADAQETPAQRQKVNQTCNSLGLTNEVLQNIYATGEKAIIDKVIQKTKLHGGGVYYYLAELYEEVGIEFLADASQYISESTGDVIHCVFGIPSTKLKVLGVNVAVEPIHK